MRAARGAGARGPLPTLAAPDDSNDSMDEEDLGAFGDNSAALDPYDTDIQGTGLGRSGSATAATAAGAAASGDGAGGWLTGVLTATQKMAAVQWPFFSVGRTSSIDSTLIGPSSTSGSGDASIDDSEGAADDDDDDEATPTNSGLGAAFVTTGSVSEHHYEERLRASSSDSALRDALVFSAMMFCYWDNTVGPFIEWTWPDESMVNNEQMVYVSRYTLNSEVGRSGDLKDAIEIKFTVLGDNHLAICAFVFTGQKPPSGSSKHALCLVMPENNVSRFLVYYPILARRIPPILERFRILQATRLNHQAAMELLSSQLLQLTMGLQDLVKYSLPTEIRIKDTIFGANATMEKDKAFLRRMLTSFLKTHGFAIVIGDDVSTINMIICTLALFLSPQERRRCRLAHPDCRTVTPELRLQGVVQQDIAEQVLLEYSFPITIVDLRSSKVEHAPIYHEYVMVRKQWHEAERKQLVDTGAIDASALITISQGRLLDPVKEGAPFVDALLTEIAKLPFALRKTYIADFSRVMTRRAVALLKYCAAETAALPEKMLTQQAVRKIRGDLGLSDNNLFLSVLAVAERMHRGIFTQMIEDPISMEERFREMLATF